MESKSLLLEKYVKIMFGKRAFYLPRIPANIYYEDNNTISIDMCDMEEYVIVDGIRCYYYIEYHADNDTVNTWLKDYTIGGLVCAQLTPFLFQLSDREFPFSKRDPRLVVPKRDYSELTSEFLLEHKGLNEKLVKFLEQHPETFEQADISKWLAMSDNITEGELDPVYFSEPELSELFQRVIS